MKLNKFYTITLSEEEAKDLFYYTKWADVDMQNATEMRDYVDTVESIYQTLKEEFDGTQNQTNQ